jgi:hypothetical protein
MFRRNVFFNERSFPARLDTKIHRPLMPAGEVENTDKGEDLIGEEFADEGETFTVVGTDFKSGQDVLACVNKEGKDFYSTVAEVREWHNATKLALSACANYAEICSASKRPHKCINALACAVHLQIQNAATTARQQQYKCGVPVPRSYKQAGNLGNEWFQSEDKEKKGILSFNTWQRIPQDRVTPATRKLALRAHHLYDVKRTMKKKNRVVINGSRQHPSTYSDTASPVASQLQLRIFLAIMANRQCHIEQLNLTNACLHASIKDTALIIIPEGFPGENEIAILRQAGCGTKQGARRFYDHTTTTLNSIGLKNSPSEPCLFRCLGPEGACFALAHVDGSLLGGDKAAVEKIKNELKQKFQCKFQIPVDFLGMDVKINSPGDIELSMRTFSKKMIDTLQTQDNVRANIYTPGRTGCKITKPNDDDKTNTDNKDDGTCRSKVGSLNWLIMCLRCDVVYATKELSRVLSSPTPLARSLLQRAPLCAKRTAHATLRFRYTDMSTYTPPPTRKKPTDLDA